MGNSPASLAVNSMMTGVVPRGISFLTLNFLISTPCTPSAETTRRRDTLADGDLDARGFERKAARDDIDLAWCVLPRGTIDGPRRSTDKDRNRDQSNN